MSKEYDIEIYGHPSLLSPKNRKIKIYFSEPELGINEKTGIVLFIAGFGGNANSNVYKKMRSEFSDKYNLITIQCDYFGWEFMQESGNIALDINRNTLEKQIGKENTKYVYETGFDFQKLVNTLSEHGININCKATLNETLENYNDMGLMQAIDNISAVLCVIELLKDNKYNFNKDKIILYGQSHGAYLAYLSNALAPNLFSLLIDNSSWLFPQYLKGSRYLYKEYENSTLQIEFNYLASTLNYDKEILSLDSLYKKFQNQCDIICYHGTKDNLISHKDKKKLRYVIDRFYYNEIGESKIDNEVFKSTEHGLNADFLKLFNYTVKNHNFKKRIKSNYIDDIIIYETNRNIYLINYKNIVPKINVKSKT